MGVIREDNYTLQRRKMGKAPQCKSEDVGIMCEKTRDHTTPHHPTQTFQYIQVPNLSGKIQFTSNKGKVQDVGKDEKIEDILEEEWCKEEQNLRGT